VLTRREAIGAAVGVLAGAAIPALPVLPAVVAKARLIHVASMCASCQEPWVCVAIFTNGARLRVDSSEDVSGTVWKLKGTVLEVLDKINNRMDDIERRNGNVSWRFD